MDRNTKKTSIQRKDFKEAKKRAKAQRVQKMAQQTSTGVKSETTKRIIYDKKKALLITGIVVVFVAIVVMVFFITTQRKPREEELLEYIQSGVFATTTTIEGVDVSGYTIEQSREIISPALDEKFKNTTINYNVNGESFTKDAYEMGLISDIEDVLVDAMLFEKSGNVFERAEKQKIAQTQGQHYTITIIAEAENVAVAAKKFIPAHGLVPVEPTMTFNADAKDESEIFEWTDEVVGFEVDEALFVAHVLDYINSGNYDLGEVDIQEIMPQKTKAMMQDSVVKISEYTTFFGTGDLDDDDRVSNIRLMASILSGAVIKPGEEWSINETTGERTEDKGWQEGHSIRRGVMIDELGGGVCQVSSTLYNAFLLAEVGIVERHNHTILSIYVDRKSRDEYYLQHEAADATIDYPRKDLKIKNILDDDIYIVIMVDNETDDHEGVTAMIYGPKPSHDYKVIIRTIEDESNAPKPSADAQYIVAENGLAPDGTYVSVGSPYAAPARTDGSYWTTYKYYYPKDTELQDVYSEKKVSIPQEIVYSWVGYEEGDYDSGQKFRLSFEGTDEYIDSIYPAQNGTYYLNPNDPLSKGMEGSTYVPPVEESSEDEATSDETAAE